eukprot:gene7920-12388_t
MENTNLMNLQEDKSTNFMIKIFDLYKKISPRVIPILSLITFAITFIINILSSTTNVLGSRQNEVSDSYPNLFTPAGYAFSIWSVIYFYNGLFIATQIPFIFTGKYNSILFGKIGIFYPILNVLNMMWVIVFANRAILLSFFVIFSMWVVLFIIYFRIDTGFSKSFRNRKVDENATVSWWELYIVQPTFSLYFGWLTVATFANWFIAGLKDPFNILNEAQFTALIIAFTTLPALLALVWRRDVFFSFIICWGVVAIAVKQSSGNSIVFTSAWVNAFIVACSTIVAIGDLVIRKIIDVAFFIKEKYENQNKEEESVEI